MQANKRIPDTEIQAAGGEWAQYGEITGPQLLQLLQQDKLRFVFANNSFLVSIQRPDGVIGDYQLIHTAFPAVAPAELSSELDKIWTLPELLPLFQKYGQQYGFDYRVLAAVAYQESGGPTPSGPIFKNWKVHRDGTGFGLFGLDDNGLLPAFEQWSHLDVGRGDQHRPVTPNQQIEYAAMQLAAYQRAYGSDILATQAWHRGSGQMNDEQGVAYGNIIRAHVRTLFP